MEALNASIQNMDHESRAMVHQMHAEQAREAAGRMRLTRCERDADVLDATQQCLGGTVIQKNGHSYTQILGANQAPIRCTGRYARQALRRVPGCGL